MDEWANEEENETAEEVINIQISVGFQYQRTVTTRIENFGPVRPTAETLMYVLSKTQVKDCIDIVQIIGRRVEISFQNQRGKPIF